MAKSSECGGEGGRAPGHHYVPPDWKSLWLGLREPSTFSANGLSVLTKASGPGPCAETRGSSQRPSPRSSVHWQVIPTLPRASFKQGKVGGRGRL